MLGAIDLSVSLHSLSKATCQIHQVNVPTLPTSGILQGPPDLKELAATGLGEVIKLTSPEALKPSVVNITGPLIRILGDRCVRVFVESFCHGGWCSFCRASTSCILDLILISCILDHNLILISTFLDLISISS